MATMVVVQQHLPSRSHRTTQDVPCRDHLVCAFDVGNPSETAGRQDDDIRLQFADQIAVGESVEPEGNPKSIEFGQAPIDDASKVGPARIACGKHHLTAGEWHGLNDADVVASFCSYPCCLKPRRTSADHSNAFGGGVGLACVCDVTIGIETAKFGLTETKLGLVPATIGPYVLARLGEAMARRVFMSSRVFGADEAVTLGVLAKAVSADKLDAAVEAEVAPYLSCAPKAVAAAKAMARGLGPTISQVEIARSVDALMDIWEGEEATQGLAAFFGKTKAPWVVA